MKSLSRVQLFATPWTVAYQAPPSLGFSRQEYWSGLPFPSPGDLPKPGIEPGLPALQTDALLSEPPGRPLVWPQVNNREGTQPHPSTENWIKDLLNMALPTRARPSFAHSQSLPCTAVGKESACNAGETPVQFLDWEDPLEKEMATHSSILARRIPWTEEPGRLQFLGLHGVRHD